VTIDDLLVTRLPQAFEDKGYYYQPHFENLDYPAVRRSGGLQSLPIYGTGKSLFNINILVFKS
jgi:hypothetical protein